jgi:hypothetical protein
LDDLNARESSVVDDLAAGLSSPEALDLRAAAGQFQRALALDAADDPSARPGPDFDVADTGARAFLTILGRHPSVDGQRRFEVAMNVFQPGASDPLDSPLLLLGRESVSCAVAGAISLGQQDTVDDRLFEALFQTAFGASAVDAIVRRALAGFLDPLWDPVKFHEELQPVGLADIEALARRGCVQDILGGLRGFAGELASVQDAFEARGSASADGITGLVPLGARGRTQVTIAGSGFGASQGPNRDVLFPRAGGGCSRANVVAWSDTLIVAEAPTDVGEGHVGFVTVLSRPTESSSGPSSGQLAGALEHCIGPAASAAADRLHHWMPGGALPPACPPPLANDANHFFGGPAIASISPGDAREGDSVSVVGTAFATSDVVVVDGHPASTTVVTGRHLTFLVPAVSGGRHRITVNGTDGLHSNGVDLKVRPWIQSIGTARPRPGTPVTIVGTGFQSGCRVRVDSEERAGAYIGPHDVQVALWRPASVAHSKAGEPVAVQVVLPDGTASNSVTVTLDTYRIVALGDSMMWGQGLEPAQKFDRFVAQAIQSRVGGVGVYDEDVGAHSGAIIGLIPFVNPTGGAVAGEVPVSEPTVFQQLEGWFFDPERTNVDLVLITGGINDVGVNTILDPTTFSSTINAACRLHCHDSMKLLLTDAVGTFGKDTKIVVTGYQLMVSWASDTAQLTEFLIALGVALGAINGAIVGGVVSLWAKWAVVVNCATFYSEANKQLALAVAEVNASLGGTPRVFFAVPPFADDNAALAPDSWLWGITLDPLKGPVPEDPVATSRATQCALAAQVRPGFDVNRCKIASLGHPNPTGAQRYADAILQVL